MFGFRLDEMKGFLLDEILGFKLLEIVGFRLLLMKGFFEDDTDGFRLDGIFIFVSPFVEQVILTFLYNSKFRELLLALSNKNALAVFENYIRQGINIKLNYCF
jgi:hypothetical protein